MSANVEREFEAALEVDDDTEGEDESYGSGNVSDTTSISSSILAYEYENGRRYHAFRSGKYALPNDEQEQDRLDMMHHIYSLLLGGQLHLAPLQDPHRILDVGCGTGIWVIDMADKFPSAEVTGTDLSPIQPGWVPPNSMFVIEDAEGEWTWSKPFDFIHVRGMAGSIKDWPLLIKNAYESLAPGGYLEIFEAPVFDLLSDDGTYNDKTALWRYYSLVREASKKTGRSLQLDGKFAEHFAKAGFVDYDVTVKKMPLGAWPADKRMKELGKWMALMVESGFEAYGLALLTRVLSLPTEEAKQLFEDCKKEVMNRTVHSYFHIHVMVAMKPDSPAVSKMLNTAR
ncbi:TAM domain methyltransferase [Sphaerosporella brunnea]|uniref:TAM domain methyltransferase n=1 Tax=Sphaerosporella brunnea TaxID=1250544 RepID=A0A5J5FC75_9PEZI|nr:TAM domain methyltransferase [Sphaerosporella brunnea]